MKILDFLKEESVIPNLGAKTKDAVLHEIASEIGRASCRERVRL